MSTTKRKFNALLNGIGNKSTTSLTSSHNNSRVDLNTPTDADSQKRRRISNETSNPLQSSASVRHVTPASRTSTVFLHHKKATTPATASTSQETPKYAPWDRAAFLQRLKSFSNLTDWTPKPARVNEVEWAKRGWVCQKKERVRCCLCNVEIIVKLNKKEVDGKEEPVYVAQNIEDALVDKYVGLIVESHEENCLWRKRGCDDSIFKLSLNHPATTIHNLRQRYDELVTRKDTLPYMFNLRIPDELELDTVITHLSKDFYDSSGDTADVQSLLPALNKVAFSLALFGWQGHKHERLGSQLGSISCQACFRVLGLWLFKSKEVNEAGEEVVGAAVNCLDVVKEHREYCPWRNAASQSGLNPTAEAASSALAAWEVVVRVLKNDYYLRNANEKSAKKPSPARPSTPQREQMPQVDGEDVDDADAQSIRDEEDKKRWARLRRVKSIFSSKIDKKITKTDPSKK